MKRAQAVYDNDQRLFVAVLDALCLGQLGEFATVEELCADAGAVAVVARTSKAWRLLCDMKGTADTLGVSNGLVEYALSGADRLAMALSLPKFPDTVTSSTEAMEAIAADDSLAVTLMGNASAMLMMFGDDEKLSAIALSDAAIDSVLGSASKVSSILANSHIGRIIASDTVMPKFAKSQTAMRQLVRHPDSLAAVLDDEKARWLCNAQEWTAGDLGLAQDRGTGTQPALSYGTHAEAAISTKGLKSQKLLVIANSGKPDHGSLRPGTSTTCLAYESGKCYLEDENGDKALWIAKSNLLMFADFNNDKFEGHKYSGRGYYTITIDYFKEA